MHDGHRKRLRQRYKRVGIDGFAEHEMLELLLFYAIPRHDVNELAHRVLNAFGGKLQGVFGASIAELMSVDGIGEQAAVFLHLVGGIHKHMAVAQVSGRVRIRTPQEAGELAYQLLTNRKTEAFYAIMLDNQSRLIQSELIAEGTTDTTLVNVRKVVEAAMRLGASYVVLAHNHPGGSTKPSTADIQLSDNLEKVLSAIGITYVEHIIVADGRFHAIKRQQDYPISPGLPGKGSVSNAAETAQTMDARQLAALLKSMDTAILNGVKDLLDEGK